MGGRAQQLPPGPLTAAVGVSEEGWVANQEARPGVTAANDTGGGGGGEGLPKQANKFLRDLTEVSHL